MEKRIRIAEPCSPLDRADVMICFAGNETILDNMRMAAERNMSVVAGTRGLSEEEMNRIKGLAVRTRCVLVPSLGPDESVINGAVRAAKWIVRQNNGLYDMQDVKESF